jgi:hypothetical protein
VQALSGPLADIELRGNFFVTDDHGDTVFDSRQAWRHSPARPR